MTELLNIGEKAILHTLKEKSYSKYITRMRKFNFYIIINLWISLFIYIFSLTIKYLKLFKLSLAINDTIIINSYFVKILILLTIGLFLSIIILLFKSIATYNKTTKIQ